MDSDGDIDSATVSTDANADGATTALGNMSPAAAASGLSSSSPSKPDLLVGVVEGFYGRPWTTEQRKDLFTKMQQWGLTSYLYAPKDDCKHRAYWRQSYTVEEAEHLASLVAMARDCDIDFYYAISPGLDITYSNAKEVACLKRKLDQVSQLGCKSFALLFDDIDQDLQDKQDKEVFHSLAHAQVTLTNDVHDHLGGPKFVFCPTQYCTARAFPSIRNSEYLNTIGAKLAPQINIMWTGDKVISKVISRKSLEDINDVLKRPVVIWDNAHANDYDQKRVFLGPYSGRSPDVIQSVRGVFTNPNCEYGANFIAINTLAQWSKCKVDGTASFYRSGNVSDAVTADIRLEISAGVDDDDDVSNPAGVGGGVNCDIAIDGIEAAAAANSPVVAADSPAGDHVNAPVATALQSDLVYHPKTALAKAVKAWLPEFSRQKTVWGPMTKPQVGLTAPVMPPTFNACINSAIMPATASDFPHPEIATAADETTPTVVTTTTTTPTVTPHHPTPLIQMQTLAPGVASVPNPSTSVISSAVASAPAATVPVMVNANGLQIVATIPITQPMMTPAAATISGSASSSSTTGTPPSASSILPPVPQIAPAAAAASAVQPISAPVMNSLVSTNKVIVDQSLLNTAAANPTAVHTAHTAVVSATGIIPSPAAAVPVAAPVIVSVPIPRDPTMATGIPVVAPVVANPGPVLNPVLPTVDDDAPMQAANTIPQVTDAVMPGPTYLEAMEDDESGAKSDVAMESHPPTPAGSMHKAESTTMLCEDSGGTACGTANTSSSSEANLSSGEVSTMVCDDAVATSTATATTAMPQKGLQHREMEARDLMVLCQLFFLPADHGAVGLQLLEDFFWLKRNANSMIPPGTAGAGTAEDRHEWERRAAKFRKTVADIQSLFVKLCACRNRELVYDLYTYLWDMCGVVQTLDGFVQWMSKGSVSPKSQNYVVGQQTWFSGIREAFSSGDHEPWMFRGGLISDLQRLLPLDSGSDLYLVKYPDVPASLLFYVRPFQPADEEAVYSLAADAYERTIDAPMGLCPADRELVGDKVVGAYLTLCPEYSFVCESSVDGSIVAFVVAAPDAKKLFTRHSMAWLPEMRIKHKRPAGSAPLRSQLGDQPQSEQSATDQSANEEVMLTPIEQMAESFHAAPDPGLPEHVRAAGDCEPYQPWAVAHMHIAYNVLECSVARRLTMLLLASLRASGTVRLYVETASVREREFYSTVGFGILAPGSSSGDLVYMSRSF